MRPLLSKAQELPSSALASLRGSTRGASTRCGCAVAARVKNALIAVCQEQADLHSALHARYGVEIEEVNPMPGSLMCTLARKQHNLKSLLPVQVRMAPDNLTAYVLWDAFPGPARDAAAELERL